MAYDHEKNQKKFENNRRKSYPSYTHLSNNNDKEPMKSKLYHEEIHLTIPWKGVTNIFNFLPSIGIIMSNYQEYKQHKKNKNHRVFFQHAIQLSLRKYIKQNVTQYILGNNGHA